MAMAGKDSAPYYFVPGLSRHPIRGAFCLFWVVLGASQWVNGVPWGSYVLLLGLAGWLVVVFQWLRDAVLENQAGLYGRKIDLSYRWSMSWFIFSEVMLFGAFFTALWWTRAHSVPALGGAENALLWPDFQAVWPSSMEGFTASPAGTVEPFQAMGPFWLPTINTMLLLASGVTLTLAHHALQQGFRWRTLWCMGGTLCLGGAFLAVQAYEYHHAWLDLNLTLRSGVYGATFYMLTGFHGLHVLLGWVMLAVITWRLYLGHFSAERHFGFEAAAWYWHFVDAVWLGLYLLVYWW